MRKINLKVLTLFLPFLILFFLTGIFLYLERDYLLAVAQNIQNKLEKGEESSVDLNLDADWLMVKFDINKRDEDKMKVFLEELGADWSVVEGIGLEVDRESLELLSQNLPLHLKLEIEPKKLLFKNKSGFYLPSGRSFRDFSLATGSAFLDLKVASNDQGSFSNDFKLNISEPGLILEQATSSSKLQISKKLDSLFPILEKIATIKLEVSGRYVSGEIGLK